MLDIRMKDENTSWQEWYEQNPRLRLWDVDKRKLTYGVGLNDLDYTSSIFDKSTDKQILLYRCKKYRAWEKMLQRAYSKKWSEKYPTYIGVGVSDDFKSAKRFSEWMDTQITVEGNEILQLDKDILFPGNKIYSADTCCFVPQFINKSLNVCERASGNLPIGVSVTSSSMYYGKLHKKNNVTITLGRFDTPEEAHKAWQLGRASLIEEALDTYSNMVCYREDVDAAVRTRVSKLRQDAASGKQTLQLE